MKKSKHNIPEAIRYNKRSPKSGTCSFIKISEQSPINNLLIYIKDLGK